MTNAPRYVPPMNRISHQNEVTTSIAIEDALAIEMVLPDLVETLTSPLFEIFNFFTVPKQTIINELNEMRRIR